MFPCQEYFQKFQGIKEAETTGGLDSLERFLHGSKRAPMPPAAPEIGTPPDACRVHGIIPIQRVAGNFHVTAGKSIHFGGSHIHMAGSIPRERYNFSHRFDLLSFASSDVGANTLDGTLQLSLEHDNVYQYFLKVVPTSTLRLDQLEPFWSNQYSVSEQKTRAENTLPGIYIKYDMEPVSVRIHEERAPIVGFVVRLCGIIGGVFATTGMLHQMGGSVVAAVAGDSSARSIPVTSPPECQS